MYFVRNPNKSLAYYVPFLGEHEGYYFPKTKKTGNLVYMIYMVKLSTQIGLVKFYVYTPVFVFAVYVSTVCLRKGTNTQLTHRVSNNVKKVTPVNFP